MRTRLVCALALMLLPTSMIAQAGRVEHLKRGDTTIVRTTGNGLWGAPHDAGEVKRIGGESDATTFGFIIALEALPSGGVVFFDGRALEGQAMRVLGPDGRLMKTLGRNGGGPGEHGGCGLDCLAVAGDGTISMLDHDNGRVDNYRMDGTALGSFSMHAGFGRGPQILAGPGNTLYLRIWASIRPNRPQTDPEDMARLGYQHIGPTGRIIDTIPAPTSWLRTLPQSMLEPTTQWLMLPDGRLAVGGTDRLAVLLRPAKGVGPLLLMEAPTQRASYLAAERQEMRALFAWANNLRDGGHPLPNDPPPLKPAYSALGIDHDGRIWLQRRVTAIKNPNKPPEKDEEAMTESGAPMPKQPPITFTEPPTFAGFKLDGTYLGEVRFPLNATHITFTGDFAWAVVTDKEGMESIVKYRIH